MIHARRDYDAIQPWPTKRPHNGRDPLTGRVVLNAYADEDLSPIIPNDEPVLLIRGQDLAALPALDAWCEAAMALGAEKELIDAVVKHRDLIVAWQADHAKVPDADKGLLR